MHDPNKEWMASTEITNLVSQRALIVDDHPVYRDGLREVLESIPGTTVCGEAEDEDDAFSLFTMCNADLLTVDICLACGSGLNLISRVKDYQPSAIVLAVSMYEDGIYAELALAAGAAGYVCKAASRNELKVALQTVLGGQVFIGTNRLGQPILSRKSSSAAINLNEKRLSSRELQILVLIGQGRTTRQIAEALKLAVSTVETFRERLKTKMGLSSGPELTRYAILWTFESGRGGRG